MSSTSFQKKGRGKVIQIPGTRPSLHNNQLLVSSGIPSLDNILGGGIAVGTVVLVEQDTYGSYSRLMLKYFCAESIMCKHHLLLASADMEPSQLLSELPGAIVDDPGSEIRKGDTADDPLKIAWRYQHLSQVQAGVGGCKFCHYYDLTKTMDPAVLEAAPKNLHYISEHDTSTDSHNKEVMKPSYCKLLKIIQDEIESGKFGTAVSGQQQQQQKNILRIGIESLGSPLWGEAGGLTADHSSYDPSLPRFLYALRSLIRSAFATCFITMPSHLFLDKGFIHRIEHLCDTVLHLESFVGDSRETNPVYSQYHGLFNIRRLPRLNTLACHMPDTLDLAFKLKRKKFMIERLHLPPELSETASRSEEDPIKANVARNPAASLMGMKNKLDF